MNVVPTRIRKLFSGYDSYGDKEKKVDCKQPTWNFDADEKIEVKIFYQKGYLGAANAVQGYAEYAIAEAFGDEYRVDVTVGQGVPQDVVYTDDTANSFANWLNRSADSQAKDCNHLVHDAGTYLGGGSSSVSGGAKKIAGALKRQCVKRKGGTEAHEMMNYNLHEIGHCLGFDHIMQDNNPICPMATSYVNGHTWVHEYSSRSKGELTVQ